MAFVAHTEKIVYGEGVVNLFVDMGVGIGGDKWPAADVFCKIISDEKWKPFFSKLFLNRTCLELGSGTGNSFFVLCDTHIDVHVFPGLVGILIDQMFKPKQVVITDLEDHMGLITKNVSLNNCTSVSLQEYDWCRIPSIGTFDIILVFEW
jgi:hypothetical protein